MKFQSILAVAALALAANGATIDAADPNCDCHGVCSISGGTHNFAFSGKHVKTQGEVTIYENKKFLDNFSVNGRTLSASQGSLLHMVTIHDGILPKIYTADINCIGKSEKPIIADVTKKVGSGEVNVQIKCMWAKDQFAHLLYHFQVTVKKTNSGVGNFEANEKSATGVCVSGMQSARNLRSDGARVLKGRAHGAKRAPQCTCKAGCAVDSSGDGVQTFKNVATKLEDQENLVVFKQGAVNVQVTKSNGLITAVTATGGKKAKGDKTIQHTVQDCDEKEQPMGSFSLSTKTGQVSVSVECKKTTGLFSAHKTYLKFDIEETISMNADLDFEQQMQKSKGTGACLN